MYFVFLEMADVVSSSSGSRYHLKCFRCKSQLKDAKILKTCQHSFCRDCFDVRLFQEGDHSSHCSECFMEFHREDIKTYVWYHIARLVLKAGPRPVAVAANQQPPAKRLRKDELPLSFEDMFSKTWTQDASFVISGVTATCKNFVFISNDRACFAEECSIFIVERNNPNSRTHIRWPSIGDINYMHAYEDGTAPPANGKYIFATDKGLFTVDGHGNILQYLSTEECHHFCVYNQGS